MSSKESKTKELVRENFELLKQIENLKTEKLKVEKQIENLSNKYNENAQALNTSKLDDLENDDDWYGSNQVNEIIHDDWLDSGCSWASSSWCSR